MSGGGITAAGLLVLLLALIGLAVGLYYAYICLRARPVRPRQHTDCEDGPLIALDPDVNGNHEDVPAEASAPMDDDSDAKSKLIPDDANKGKVIPNDSSGPLDSTPNGPAKERETILVPIEEKPEPTKLIHENEISPAVNHVAPIGLVAPIGFVAPTGQIPQDETPVHPQTPRKVESAKQERAEPKAHHPINSPVPVFVPVSTVVGKKPVTDSDEEDGLLLQKCAPDDDSLERESCSEVSATPPQEKTVQEIPASAPQSETSSPTESRDSPVSHPETLPAEDEAKEPYAEVTTEVMMPAKEAEPISKTEAAAPECEEKGDDSYREDDGDLSCDESLRGTPQRMLMKEEVENLQPVQEASSPSNLIIPKVATEEGSGQEVHLPSDDKRMVEDDQLLKEPETSLDSPVETDILVPEETTEGTADTSEVMKYPEVVYLETSKPQLSDKQEESSDSSESDDDVSSYVEHPESNVSRRTVCPEEPAVEEIKPDADDLLETVPELTSDSVPSAAAEKEVSKEDDSSFPKEEAAEASEKEVDEVLKDETDEVPEKEVTEVLKEEIIDIPKEEVVEVPEEEVVEVPKEEVVEVPKEEVEVTKEEIAEVPKEEVAEIPNVVAAEVPKVVAEVPKVVAEVPKVEVAEVPKVEVAEVPKEGDKDTSEAVVIPVASSPLEESKSEFTERQLEPKEVAAPRVPLAVPLDSINRACEVPPDVPLEAEGSYYSDSMDEGSTLEVIKEEGSVDTDLESTDTETSDPEVTQYTFDYGSRVPSTSKILADEISSTVEPEVTKYSRISELELSDHESEAPKDGVDRVKPVPMISSDNVTIPVDKNTSTPGVVVGNQGEGTTAMVGLPVSVKEDSDAEASDKEDSDTEISETDSEGEEMEPEVKEEIITVPTVLSQPMSLPEGKVSRVDNADSKEVLESSESDSEVEVTVKKEIITVPLVPQSEQAAAPVSSSAVAPLTSTPIAKNKTETEPEACDREVHEKHTEQIPQVTFFNTPDQSAISLSTSSLSSASDLSDDEVTSTSRKSKIPRLVERHAS